MDKKYAADNIILSQGLLNDLQSGKFVRAKDRIKIIERNLKLIHKEIVSKQAQKEYKKVGGLLHQDGIKINMPKVNLK